MDNKGGVNDDEQEGQPSAFQCFPSSKHDHRLSAPAPFSSSPVTSRQLNNAPRVALTEKVHITNHSEDFQLGKTACAITDPVGPRLQANVRSLSSEVIQDNWSMNDISSQNIFRNVMNYCDPKFPPSMAHIPKVQCLSLSLLLAFRSGHKKLSSMFLHFLRREASCASPDKECGLAHYPSNPF